MGKIVKFYPQCYSAQKNILMIPKLLSLLTLNTLMKETTKPGYYQQCSPLGRELLEKADFPEGKTEEDPMFCELCNP